MDKTDSPKQRKGIALLITLVTIAMIIVIIGTLLGALDSVRKDSKGTTALLQANIYYADIAKLLKEFDQKEVLFKTLYQSPIPFMSEDGAVSIVIQCKPLLAGVNINWLGMERDTKKYPKYAITQKLFDDIAAKYTLEDPAMLLEMLLEEIGSQSKFVKKPKSRLFQKRGIMTIQQFEAILSRYQMLADDPGAGRVPWDRLFSFVPEAEVIDGDNMSAELVSLLFDIDLAVVQEEWQQEEGALARFALTYGLEYDNKIFTTKFTEYAQCEVGYDYAQERYRFSFVDMNGEVKHFEFYGRQ
jgi:hypothetical protein